MKTIKTFDCFVVNKVNGDKIEITNEIINENSVNYRHYSKVINGKTVMEYTIPIAERRMYRFGVQVLSVEWDSK